MTFVGLNLNKRYITACALDTAGRVAGAAHARLAEGYPTTLFWSGDVGMEATLHWQ